MTGHGNPYLYDLDDPAKILLGRNDAGQLDDFRETRKASPSSVIPETTLTLGLSAPPGMLPLHNAVVDVFAVRVWQRPICRASAPHIRWHYQWVVSTIFCRA